MGFTFLKKLPTPAEIRNQYPIDTAIQELKAKRDQEIRDVFTGKSDKFLAIIGPCSADNEDAVCDYLLRLRKVQEKIEDKVLIIPRVYTNKPRTTGEALPVRDFDSTSAAPATYDPPPWYTGTNRSSRYWQNQPLAQPNPRPGQWREFQS